MQRVALHTVTDIPVVIPCEDGKPYDGHANFDSKTITLEIRIVKTDELKNLRMSLSPREARFLADCLALKQAHNSRDQLALAGPYERLLPFTRRMPISDIPELAKIFASSPGWIPIFLPQVVSIALRNVRLVLWWVDFDKEDNFGSFDKGIFTPAIFCPDVKTALFLKGLLGEIRICPRCEKLFVPRNANVDYCSPAHRDAHRVARWRAQKKTKRIAMKAKRASATKKRES